MVGHKVQHFDVAALLRAVFDQPIGLRVSTNHPAGFRRIVYAHLHKNPGLRLSILQCPKSASALLLLREDFKLEEKAA